MISKIDSEYMKGKLRNGEFILFCGAGISCDLVNNKGTQLPKGDELQRKIWNVAFPEDAFENDTTLQTIYHAAQKRHKTKLAELLKETFDVRSSSIRDHHKGLLFGPWRRVYSLNIDNCVQRIHRHNGRTSNSISAFDSRAYEISDRLNFIHLHGTYAGIPDDIIFSFQHYNEIAAMENIYHKKFAIDYSVSPVIFIGTAIDEPHLWASIQRRNAAIKGSLKPKSYIVSPKLSKSRAETLADYNLVHIQATAEEFYGYIKSNAHAEYLEGIQRTLILTGDDMPELSMISMTSGSKSYYLEGAEPTFADVKQNLAIEREFVRNLNQNTLSIPAVGIIGTAGSGKTTSLMQHALYIKANLPDKVYWLPVEMETSTLPYSKISSLSTGSFLFVDDINRFKQDAIDWLANECISKGIKLRYACRSNSADRISSLISNYSNPSEQAVPDLCESDIDDLLQLLSRTKNLGKLKNMQIEMQKTVLREKCDRKLLVAMIEATSGIKFEEKIQSEFDDISDDAQKRIYAMCCIVMTVSGKAKKQHIIGATPLNPLECFHALERLIASNILAVSGDKIYPRHKLIGEIVFDYLTRSGHTKTLILELISYLGSTTIQHFQSEEMRIISKFYGHTFLMRMFDLSIIREIYSDIETLLSWDSHFWLHRGALELEIGSLDQAEIYLNRSKSLSDPSYPNYMLMTELGYYHMKRSIKASDSASAKWSFEQAKIELELLMSVNGKKDPRCFHIYCIGLLNYAKKWIIDNDEKRSTYEIGRSACQQGLRWHRSNAMLKNAMDELSRAKLMTTVGP